MSNIDKQTLREIAEKATPGPWLWINTGSYFSFLVPRSNQDPHNCIIDDGSSWGEYGETINPESPDGVFISAANPATVLALLDELEAAEKRIAELEAESSIEAKRLLSRRAAMLQGADGNSPVIPDCSCGTCRPVTFTDSRFIVCSECGNKRCPHANDHRNACTGSNEPSQEGSSYPASPQQEVKP